MKDETFCIYCQEEFKSPEALRDHITTEHPGTYADYSVNLSWRKGS